MYTTEMMPLSSFRSFWSTSGGKILYGSSLKYPTVSVPPHFKGPSLPYGHLVAAAGLLPHAYTHGKCGIA